MFSIHFPGRIQQLVRGFAADWKKSIENINQEIMRSFSNFKNGTTILQVSSINYLCRGSEIEGEGGLKGALASHKKIMVGPMPPLNACYLLYWLFCCWVNPVLKQAKLCCKMRWDIHLHI